MAKAPRNRTIELADGERERLSRRLSRLEAPASPGDLKDAVVNQDIMKAAVFLPADFVDLMFVDPPYNLTKDFNGRTFKQRSSEDYAAWLESWMPSLLPPLKRTASVYVCADWRSAGAVQAVCEKYFTVQNRITFEREKGRGARSNWKSAAEDIWFCTVSKDYHFDLDAVKIKRRVVAPYTENGEPKDWSEGPRGRFRLTCPSNLWTDISMPFWSMPENTPHPTQKPEKLLAKIVLSGSRPGDMVFDPFCGSGTTAAVCKKLGRRFLMVEIDREYCLYAAKRIELAEHDKTIQGYEDGVFFERNAGPTRRRG